MHNTWWTEEQLRTDAHGTARFRGFKGDYRLTLEKEGFRPVQRTPTLRTDTEVPHLIVLPSRQSSSPGERDFSVNPEEAEQARADGLWYRHGWVETRSPSAHKVPPDGTLPLPTCPCLCLTHRLRS